MAALDAAQPAGDESRTLELDVALYRADEELAEFISRYLRSGRG